MTVKKIYIKGMHCVSCEKLLEDEIGAVSGVRKITADRMKNLIEISYDSPAPDFSQIEKLIEKFSYKISDQKSSLRPEKKRAKIEDWIGASIIVLVVVVLFKIMEAQGFLPANLKSSQLTFGVAILTGVVASLSSCLAVVGAVIVAFSEKYESSNQSKFEKVWKPNLLFHLGRLGSFFILGGILGLIGGELNISGQFVSVYTLIIAIVMGWLGLNILGLVPSLADAGITIPKFLTREMARLKKSQNGLAPIILGGLTFFLPCGFTQSMQIMALASGSFLAGALGLFFFALGTFPVLFLIGATASFTKNKGMVIFRLAAGILILLFAVYTLSSGLALWGVKINVFSSKNTSQQTDDGNQSPSINSNMNSNPPVPQGPVQTVEMHVVSSGFSPDALTVKKGVPVEWRIYGDNVTGCTSHIIVPELNITQSISPGLNIVRFTPQKSGEIPFSCWMGMVRGKFIVE